MWSEHVHGAVRVLRVETATANWSRRRLRFEELFRKVRSQPSALWVADLRTFKDLTSEEIAQFISLARELQASGGRIVLSAPSPTVEIVLKSTRTEKLLPLFPTIEAAVDHLAPNP